MFEKKNYAATFWFGIWPRSATGDLSKANWRRTGILQTEPLAFVSVVVLDFLWLSLNILNTAMPHGLPVNHFSSPARPALEPSSEGTIRNHAHLRTLGAVFSYTSEASGELPRPSLESRRLDFTPIIVLAR